MVFNIQRFSLQDGPGIRTTVFLKGCPLHCTWCDNPESQNAYPEILVSDLGCIGCGRCIQACPVKAISMADGFRKVDFGKCNQCLKCAEACPTGAISICGRHMTTEEVMEEVRSDAVFYAKSGGGVTICGGEPLFQAEFTYELLRKAKEEGFHTALDTSGYSSWETIDAILKYTDLVLFDIKHMDPDQHKRRTGVDNRLIVDNLRRMGTHVRVWIRVPLIPGYNDSPENIRDVERLAIEVKAEKVSLLPYHEWGKAKYEKLGRKYLFEPTQFPTDDYCNEIKNKIGSLGIHVEVGG